MEPRSEADPSIPGSQDPLLEPVYRVGAVARLANIPVETLRVWERRYGIVGHAGERHRHRFYSVRDVRRLTLIKKLVELGSAISTVARLSLVELQQMYVHTTEAADDARPAAPAEAKKLRLMLVGATLRARFAAAATALRSAEVVAVGDSLDSVSAASVQADVLVVEVDTLQPALGASIERKLRAVNAGVAIIAYRFAASELLEEFALRGYVLHRAPLLIDSLDALCVVLPVKRDALTQPEVVPADMSPTPAARFDERTLARIANMSTDLLCECPRHVTELLLSVSAFEKYSAQCASRGPEDSELHQHLARVAAHCRQQFEQALIYIARVEGIALPAADS